MARPHSNNRHFIEDALRVLVNCLGPFVIDRMTESASSGRYALPRSDFVRLQERDIQFVLHTMRRTWNDVFAEKFPWSERDRVRNLIHETLDIRNRWAHQRNFDLGETFRALDTVERLLRAINEKSAADQVRLGKQELVPRSPTPRTPQPDPVQTDPTPPVTTPVPQPRVPVRPKPLRSDRPQPIIQSLMRLLLEEHSTLLRQNDVNNLLDPDYCKYTLGLNISGFSLLRSPEQGGMESGHSRYYARVYAGKYLLCSQWWKAHHLHNAEVLSLFVSELIQGNPGHPGIPALKEHQNMLNDFVNSSASLH